MAERPRSGSAAGGRGRPGVGGSAGGRGGGALLQRPCAPRAVGVARLGADRGPVAATWPPAARGPRRAPVTASGRGVGGARRAPRRSYLVLEAHLPGGAVGPEAAEARRGAAREDVGRVAPHSLARAAPPARRLQGAPRAEAQAQGYGSQVPALASRLVLE